MLSEPTESERVASELLRHLRGRRSQAGFSRRLGYRSNVAYAWESGRAWPTGARFFQILERLGTDVRGALERFYRARQPPEWLATHPPTTVEGVAALLDDLRGGRSIVEVAAAANSSRFAVSRWLKAETEPRLPDLLQMIETTSLRLLDFIACFVDPARLPSVSEAWSRLEAARRAAYEVPWSHAVLRALELEEYRALGCHRPGWIAERLGLSREAEDESLELLAKTGQIFWRDGRWTLGEPLTVDTRHDPERAQAVKAFWARAAVERLAAGAEGTFSYNVFSVSRADLERIRALHRAYFRELRAIVAESQPAECVALASVNLLELGAFSGTERSR